MPKVTHIEEATEIRYQTMCEVYDGIMPVKKVGQTHIWFSPWDYLIRWWGIEEAMMDRLFERARAHGVTLGEDELRETFAGDVILNTQGIEFWLDHRR